MLTLSDGRSELWQWDTGRTLSVPDDCSQVHFSNKVFGRSIDVDVVDGTASIPDVLLQNDKELTAWAFVGTVENGYTKISKVFKVNKRNKPADYVFTPTDKTTLGEILDRIEDLEKRPSGDVSEEDIQNAVNDYLDNNPISVEETDPTVPAWAKQPEKPKYTAAEVGALPADTVIPEIPDLSGYVVAPTEAEVGQTIIVKSVDEQGKPAEWETADLSSGGGESFVPVFSTTLDEDVNAIDITQSDNGNELSLSDARVYMVFAGTSANTKESAVSLEPWCGKEYLARRKNISIKSASRLTGTLNAFAQLHIKAKSGYMIISAEQDNGVVFLFSIEENEAKITKIRLWSDGLIAAGTTIEVWGIEA